MSRFGDGSRLVTHDKPNVYGRYFRCSKRTSEHLHMTTHALANLSRKDNRQYRLVIIQGCYNTGVELSAGTHDYDACLDVRIEGMPYPEATSFLRRHGWAAFYRQPPTFSAHIHMISLPPYQYRWVRRVGTYVPGQVADYYAKPPRDGLVSNNVDNSWHPANIRDTIFHYQEWMRTKSLLNRLVDVRRQRAGVIRKIQDLRQLAKRLAGRADDLEDRVKGLS